MSVRSLGAALSLSVLLVAGDAPAQGFAGLGSVAEDGFSVPQPDPEFRFPADHGPHPDYRIEWWYLTANLEGEDGTAYGVQWTLFRSALAPEAGEGWTTPQIWMGHAAVTTGNAHYYAETLGRGGVGQAGVTQSPFRAWIDDWEMRSTAGADEDALSALSLTARGEDFGYDLELNADGPLVFQGAEGYSVKSESGQASYYYSQPFYSVRGTLDLPSGPVEVSGRAWLDREWSSQPLDPDQSGWDWFSLHLSGGEKLMGFRLRSTTPGKQYTSATWIAADGTTQPLEPGALRVTPLAETDVAGRRVPTEWRVELPERGLDVTTRPLNPTSWMGTLFPYWEGPIFFEGSHDGRGYLEMTGYE